MENGGEMRKEERSSLSFLAKDANSKLFENHLEYCLITCILVNRKEILKRKKFIFFPLFSKNFW